VSVRSRVGRSPRLAYDETSTVLGIHPHTIRSMSATATSRRIYLLRHAKSSWDDPTLEDHERPLAPRGLKATKRLAGWIEANAVHPGLVLCSSAVRAQETLSRLAAALGSPAVTVEDGLYLASSDALLGRVMAVPGTVLELLVVGHNPGLEDLCSALGSVPTALPTGALATLGGELEQWADLAPGALSLLDIVLPRNLGRDQGTR
jgi:phosphohistidine phosphatase